MQQSIDCRKLSKRSPSLLIKTWQRASCFDLSLLRYNNSYFSMTDSQKKEAKYDMAGKSRSHNWAPHDHAGRFDHRRFVLWGPIYYEFNEGVTNNSYVGRIHKRTHFWFPPFVHTYPKSTSPSFFIPARRQIGVKLLRMWSNGNLPQWRVRSTISWFGFEVSHRASQASSP